MIAELMILKAKLDKAKRRIEELKEAILDHCDRSPNCTGLYIVAQDVIPLTAQITVCADCGKSIPSGDSGCPSCGEGRHP